MIVAVAATVVKDTTGSAVMVAISVTVTSEIVIVVGTKETSVDTTVVVSVAKIVLASVIIGASKEHAVLRSMESKVASASGSIIPVMVLVSCVLLFNTASTSVMVSVAVIVITSVGVRVVSIVMVGVTSTVSVDPGAKLDSTEVTELTYVE